MMKKQVEITIAIVPEDISQVFYSTYPNNDIRVVLLPIADMGFDYYMLLNAFKGHNTQLKKGTRT